MARIAGVNIPQDKVVHIALTYIHGIGDYNSKLICKKLSIPFNKRVNSLSEEEVLKILKLNDGHPGHIFNLGHGVLPETKPETINYVTNLVKSRK